MAVQGWHTRTVTGRMGADEEETWGFVMREADRTEQAARFVVQQDWQEEQKRKLAVLIEEKREEVRRLEEERKEEERAREAERLRVLEEEEARREMERVKMEEEKRAKEEEAERVREEARRLAQYEEDLKQALYDIEKGRREEEVRQMLREHQTQQIEESNHRVAQWYAHRDTKMRMASQRSNAKPHLTLEQERALLGFRTKDQLATDPSRTPVFSQLQEKSSETGQKLTSAHFWSAEDLIGRPMEMLEPPTPPSTAASGADVPPPVSNPPSQIPAMEMEAKEYPQRTAEMWGKGVGVRYSSGAPVEPVETPPAKRESPLPKHVKTNEWEEEFRKRVETKRKGKVPTTDQLLRQHYNRVLTGNRVPGPDEVATAKKMTAFESQIWDRRTTSAALERLLKSRQQAGLAPLGVPADATFPSLDKAASRSPPILKLTTPPTHLHLSGLYFLKPDTSLVQWESYTGNSITLHDGGWVVVPNPPAHAPIKSNGPLGAMPHEVESWLFSPDPSLPYEPSAEVTITVQDGDVNGAGNEGAGDMGVGDELVVVPPAVEGDGEQAPQQEGRVQRTDPHTSRAYVYDTKTATTAWAQGAQRGEGAEASNEDPYPAPGPSTPAARHALLTGEWIQKTDPKSNKPYYVNAVTKRTTWDLDQAVQGSR